MQLKNEHHSFVGMQRDVSISKQPTSFLYEGYNIRLTSRENDTMFAITNEKGTQTTGVSIKGSYIGHCLLDKYLVVFSTTSTIRNEDGTTEGKDYITRIDLGSTSISKKELYNGNIGFCTTDPIDAIASYESENIQKIYWTDGFNQPRMINIAPSNDDKVGSYTSKSFDFIPDLALQEEVSIEKIYSASGEFPSGMIQYAFTYYNKYGHETNIFYTTKLYAVAYKDRGASPEDKVSIAFKISINNVEKDFDYLRIYSIQRTSINAVPICKRLQDIKVSEMEETDGVIHTTYIDTGINGDSIDPTELLYKGGEVIRAKTLEQKDNTLFFGNISIKRDPVPSNLKSRLSTYFHEDSVDLDTVTLTYSMTSVTRNYDGNVISTGDIPYTNTIDYSGLKSGEVYRFGMQFQHKSGKWSEPVWLRDYRVATAASLDESMGTLTLPQVRVTIAVEDVINNLWDSGYRKARLLMVQPTNNDRTILCQGIANPVLYTSGNRHCLKEDGSIDEEKTGPLYAQSSWIFRPFYDYWSPDVYDTTADGGGGYISWNIIEDMKSLEGSSDVGGNIYYSPKLRSAEIGAVLSNGDTFHEDRSMLTIHTPELIFDESLYSEDWSNVSIKHVGNAEFSATFGDIDIQTKTPTIGSAQGFIHKPIKTAGNAALISGLFYEDYVVDDYDKDNPKYKRYDLMHVPVSWPIFMWHHTGSLNNDIQREARSAELLKKRISNYHMSSATSHVTKTPITPKGIGLFHSDEVSVIKVNGHTYMGNIDTSIVPDGPQYKYFSGAPLRTSKDTNFLSNIGYRLGLKIPGDENSKAGFYALISYEDEGGHKIMSWIPMSGDNIGDIVPALCETSEPIRMKYKSTPHLVVELDNYIERVDSCLPIVEVIRNYNKNVFFGGQSNDAMKANIWIPISKPVNINTEEGNEDNPYGITVTSDRGDTWYQRFDCLKTYAFTTEDLNQVVDIASFMVETHLNIDGRYDRNRGQSNNLNVSPRNYNLYNPVYSQLDNFFTYRIMDADYYENKTFPNQITWTKEKNSGADVDLWTNITLASVYDMDGSKGSIVSLNNWKDQILCFQPKGISKILFNSRVQIPTSDGVPIEITNSYKLDGYVYLSDGIGCNDKRLIKETASGVYFIDNVSNHLFHIADSIGDISLTHNMTSWFRNNDKIHKLVYDDINHDLYILSDDQALCYSEVLGQFVSFMDYSGIYLIETYNNRVFSLHGDTNGDTLYAMFEGDYNYFFTSYKPWMFTFVSNGIDANATDFDKIFSNIDYRMDMKSGDTFAHDKTLDTIRVQTEYQDTGYVDLIRYKMANNHKKLYSEDKNLEKKFRIWRIQIPRQKNSMNRIRNTWCRITLGNRNIDNTQAVLHDLNVQYYI